LLPVGAAEGREVTTIEGLGETAAALQEAFVAEDALQCGFCTPGQIVSASALLATVERPDRDRIRTAMAGNICRCGAYPKIERAILRASGQEPA
jgi:aerobic-type carbon monoxide dehydrogenase small subunit (CoxS/CutS family)